MTDQGPRVRWAGDRALRVDLGIAAGEAAAARAAAVVAALKAGRPPVPILDVVPAYASVMVILDPEALAAAEPKRMRAWVSARAAAAATGAGTRDGPRRRIELGVRYGGEDGPDLADVAARTGLSAEAVVALHTGREYRVFAVGFRPGYPFLGYLDPRLEVGRLPDPRLEVPAGSVGIAGRQTGVYPTRSSGGWRIIGRTDAVLFDAAAPDPNSACLLHVGDRVRFVALPGGVGAR